MKKLFIVLCDIMAVAAVVATASLAVLIFAALFKMQVVGAAMAVCITSAIAANVAGVASFIVWKKGGAPGPDEPPKREGSE